MITNIEKRIKELKDWIDRNGNQEMSVRTSHAEERRQGEYQGIRFAIKELDDELEKLGEFHHIAGTSHDYDTIVILEKDWLSLKEKLLKLTGDSHD